MKSYLVIIIVLFFAISGAAQISFEEGYFINNDGQKIDCLIKNLQWRNNPTTFTYKLSKNGEEKEGTLEQVKEFGVGNESKFCRLKVGIDRSSDDLKELTSRREADLKEETLFLSTLIEGDEVALFTYQNKNLKRYFFKAVNAEVKQLIYKRYLYDNTKLKTNYTFKSQLDKGLNCNSKSNTTNLVYTEKSLVKYFKAYFKCKNETYKKYNPRQIKDRFQLVFKPSVRLNNVTIGQELFQISTPLDPSIGYSFGLSLEYTLPFNNGKWSAIVEPTFQYYKTIQEKKNAPVSPFGTVPVNDVEYKSIEVPVGIRHYFYLNDNAKLFFNGFLITDFPIKTKVNNFSSDTPLLTLAYGGGVNIKNKYSIELRGSIRRNILNDFMTLYADFNSYSIVFGYGIL